MAENGPNHVFRTTIEVTCATAEQAQRVLAERLGYDEDYGFAYTVDWRNQLVLKAEQVHLPQDRAGLVRLACPYCGETDDLRPVETLEGLPRNGGIYRVGEKFAVEYDGETEMLWDTQLWVDRDGATTVVCRGCNAMDIPVERLVAANA